ncbi:MAG: hypothetical protein JXA13_02860 [Anaerolineales bacterium]|nr:hypothetical protein [Anaerolineales bacterium]
MYKSGLIVGGVALVLSIGVVLISPCLVLVCLAPFLGIGAGFLAGVFGKPGDKDTSTKNGAIAGAIGGAGALIGQLIGAAINSIMMGPEGVMELTRSLGLPSGGPAGEVGYWVGVVGGGICLGILDVFLMAGMGALGGILWWQITGKNLVPAAAEVIDKPKVD